MWHVALTELKQMIRLKSVMILLILAPLGLIFILGSALDFEPTDATWEPVTIACYLEDEGELAEGFKQFAMIMEENGYLSVMYVASMEELQDALYENKADGGLHIPANFSQAVVTGGSVNWDYYTGRIRLASQNGHMLLQSFLDETNRIRATVTVLGPEAMLAASEFAQEQGQHFVEQGRLHHETSPYSAMQFYSATMLVMFLLYSGMSASLSIIGTKESHLLDRLQTTPIGMHKILAGKLTGQAVLACVQAAVIVLVTHYVFDTDWGEDWGYTIMICLLVIWISMSLGFLATFLFRSTKAAAGMFSTFIMLMTFVSGGMTPIEGTFLENLQPLTLNYYAVDSFIRVMTERYGNELLMNMGILAGLGAVILTLAMFSYRKVGYNE